MHILTVPHKYIMTFIECECTQSWILLTKGYHTFTIISNKNHIIIIFDAVANNIDAAGGGL